MMQFQQSFNKGNVVTFQPGKRILCTVHVVSTLVKFVAAVILLSDKGTPQSRSTMNFEDCQCWGRFDNGGIQERVAKKGRILGIGCQKRFVAFSIDMYLINLEDIRPYLRRNSSFHLWCYTPRVCFVFWSICRYPLCNGMLAVLLANRYLQHIHNCNI